MTTSNVSQIEAVAQFRLGIIGDLLCRDLGPGELQDELKVRAARRYRPPASDVTRTFHWKTLQAWFYAAKQGPRHLEPASRARGFGLALDDEQRRLLLQIRQEHRSASAELILREAVRSGLVKERAVSLSTLRRLYAASDLARTSKTRANRQKARHRWEMAKPCAMWHADVCHLWLRTPEGAPRKAYIHGFLDDASRFVLALQARSAERESDMLSVFCSALLVAPAPAVLFLDNGACYRGEALAHACSALGIRLVHASPHDPEARGKMERFWRTLRQRCTDHLSAHATLHDVNEALLSWLDADYRWHPHAGLMGSSPLKIWQEGIRGLPGPKSPAELARALEVPTTRQVKKDGTFVVEGNTWEVGGRHLALKTIDLWIDPFTDQPLRASYQGRPVAFGRCDKVANAHRSQPKGTDIDPESSAPFDPIAGLLAAARKEVERG
jgi:putative transposase